MTKKARVVAAAAAINTGATEFPDGIIIWVDNSVVMRVMIKTAAATSPISIAVHTDEKQQKGKQTKG